MSQGFIEMEFLQALYADRPQQAREVLKDMTYGEQRQLLKVCRMATHILESAGVS